MAAVQNTDPLQTRLKPIEAGTAVAVLSLILAFGVAAIDRMDKAADKAATAATVTTSIKDSVRAVSVKEDRNFDYEQRIHAAQQLQLDSHSKILDQHTNQIQEGTAATMRVGTRQAIDDIKLDEVLSRLGRPMQYSPNGYHAGDPSLPSRHTQRAR